MKRGGTWVGLIVCGVALATTLTVIAWRQVVPEPPLVASPEHPNVVVILTDDQTVAELDVMTETKALLAGPGTTFTTSLTDFPLCCPSRVTELTGQRAINHGVTDNIGPHGGVDAFTADDETIATWLDDLGYQTAFVGHYLFGYGDLVPDFVPPGWDRWYAGVDPTSFDWFGMTVRDGDQKVTLPDTDEGYQTDAYARRAVDDIAAMAADDAPFLLEVWPLAPHNGHLGRLQPTSSAPAPAPRHAGTFAGQSAPRDPETFGGADAEGKPPEVQAYRDNLVDDFGNSTLGGDDVLETLDATWQARRESLLAVDEMVAAIVAELERTGELDNTIIVFTSDNGWLFGEHGLFYAKNMPYDPSVRVPLVIRGPGFPAGTTAPQPVSNVDIATTLVAATGSDPGITLDGTDLREVAADRDHLEDRVVWMMGPPLGLFGWEGVRTERYAYWRWPSGNTELYDMSTDPAQAHNLADEPAWGAVKARLEAARAELRDCVGEACVLEIPPSELPAPDQ